MTTLTVPGMVTSLNALIHSAAGGDALRGDVVGADSDSLTLDYTQKVLAYVPPTAYWDLNDLTGLVAKDLGGVYNGAYSGVLLGQTGMGDGKSSIYFDNNNDYMHFYSPGFAGVFSGNLYTVAGWLKVYNAAVWSDGLIHDFFFIRTDANNNCFVRLSGGYIQFNRTGGGSSKQWNVTTAGQPTTWFHVAMVCDQANDVVKSYINGTDYTPAITGNLSWSGALDSNYSLLGGSIANPAIMIHEWYGWMQHFVYYNRALSPSEVLILATQ